MTPELLEEWAYARFINRYAGLVHPVLSRLGPSKPYVPPKVSRLTKLKRRLGKRLHELSKRLDDSNCYDDWPDD